MYERFFGLGDAPFRLPDVSDQAGRR